MQTLAVHAAALLAALTGLVLAALLFAGPALAALMLLAGLILVLLLLARCGLFCCCWFRCGFCSFAIWRFSNHMRGVLD